MKKKFIIVGGDAAGMSAASKAKRDAPDLDVIVFERGEWVSYAACGMPYYVKGEVESLDDLVTMSPDAFREDRGIELRTASEVVAINPDAGTVTVESDEGRFEEAYDDLLIATGATAVIPPFDGLDLEGVFTIHDMDAAAEIDAFVTGDDVRSAAIVGGGYVGVEMAEALAGRGLSVSLFEMLPHVLAPFGEPTARVVEEHLAEKGVELHLETAVRGLSGDGRVERIVLEDGADVATDVVVIGVGVAPEVFLAEKAGIRTGPTGAIATDEYGRTNRPHVYAAGDCAEATNVVTGAPDFVPLALTANRAGRAIGQTVAGSPTETGGMAGTAIVKVFELGAARTGVIDEEKAREAGFDPVSVTISAPTRAGYYPGAGELTVTMVADGKSGRVLGASLVGREGMKRIDTVATALHAKLTVSELERLDLAYAPPYSPVWDPILTAAKVLNGKIGSRAQSDPVSAGSVRGAVSGAS